MVKDLADVVEKTLEFLENMGLTNEEAQVVCFYAYDTIKYNTIKESLRDEILTEIKKDLREHGIQV